MQSDTVVYDSLLAALSAGKKSGRVYFHGTCDATGSDVISIPQIQIESPPDMKDTALVVQRMFRGNSRFSITEAPPGIIRITGPDVVDGILQTRVSSLRLDKSEQYDPNVAISAILHAKEVQSAMRQSRTRPAITIMGRLVTMPAQGLPHLGETIENVTVDQALDTIVSRFKGIVVFKECTRPNGAHLFGITFEAE